MSSYVYEKDQRYRSLYASRRRLHALRRCLPLLNGYDDRLAVFGSGDEVVLDFDPAKLPALPKGWARDYFFVANGYEKDMDFYAAEASTVQPLPFRSMGTYPYPKGRSFPLDDSHVDYFLNYNTRHLSGTNRRLTGSTIRTNPCHPERSGCFAKRSSYEVEGPL